MIEQRLSYWLAEDKIPHALLFVGSSQAVASLAVDFAKKVVGSKKEMHPDIHHILPEGKIGMHSLSSLRSILHEATLASYGKGKKCFLVYEADRMLPTSANALLKIVEEPPPQTLFFFLTKNREKMLPTILSRLQTLFVPECSLPQKTPLQKTMLSLLLGKEEMDTIVKMLEMGKKEREKQLLADISSEITPQQRESYEKEIEGAVAMRYHEEFISLLEVILDWYRDLCILESHLPSSYLYGSEIQAKDRIPSWSLVERALKQAREALERNINAQTILESLLFRLGFYSQYG